MTYRVHTADHWVVCGRLILHRDQHTVTLSAGEVNHARLVGLRPDAVDLNNAHVVAFNPEVLTCECTDVDYTQEVRLAGLHRELEVLGFIHERRFGDRLGTSWVRDADESFQEIGHLIVVPIRQTDDKLLIILAKIRVLRISDDESLPKAVRVLAFRVRMVPIQAGLVQL